MKQAAILFALALIGSTAAAQTKAPLPALPAPQSIPQPAAKTDGPYAPQAILPGGIVVPLFPASSPYLKADKIQLPEVYNMSQTVHGRINSIVSIHNPSIEVHKVDKSINTGTAVIVIAGGGHRTLNVGGEAADFVPFFYNYGINTIILRNRLRADGYIAEVDAVRDAQQAVRVVRSYAKDLNIDPDRIGVMGFSAGAELAAPAAVLYEDWDAKNNDPSDPFSSISSRPDFVGIIYPGPTPFAQPHSADCPEKRSARFSGLWQRRRPGPHDLGARVLPGDAFGWRAQCGAASLRKRPPSRRPFARWEPHVRWIDRPQRHPVWHMAVSFYRLGSRSWLFAEARY